MKKEKWRPTFSVVDVLVLLMLLFAVTIGIYWQVEARADAVQTNDAVVLRAELEYEAYLETLRPGQTLFDREKNAIGTILAVEPETPDERVLVTLRCEIRTGAVAPGKTAELCTRELVFRATVISAETLEQGERSGSDE